MSNNGNVTPVGTASNGSETSVYSASPPNSVPEQATKRNAPPLQNLGAGGGGAARPLAELLEDPELTTPFEWDVMPLTAKGRLTLISASPKTGKTTFAAHYAVAKACGGTFLNQTLTTGRVLWVGPDEHLSDPVLRFGEISDESDGIYVWDTRVKAKPTVVDVVLEVNRLKMDLVILDTLPRIAGIEDENDNGQWTQWSADVLPLMRGTGAVWVAIHHHRKGGGPAGQGIRGASAIYGFVDIAVSIEPASDSRRRLTVDGSRYGSAEQFVVTLGDAGYVIADQDPAQRANTSEIQLIEAALTTIPETIGKIARQLAEVSDETMPETTLRRRLDELAALGRVNRDGEGGQRSPYRYSLQRGPRSLDGDDCEPVVNPEAHSSTHEDASSQDGQDA